MNNIRSVVCDSVRVAAAMKARVLWATGGLFAHANFDPLVVLTEKP